MLSSSANTAFTNRIRNSMGQIPCHGMSAPPAVTVVICYPCCRYILLPILPVRTAPLPRDRARALRLARTGVERRLWQRVRNRQLSGFKFRRQHPVGSYITDFFCVDARLVIELDGSQHGDQRGLHADERRTKYLKEQGFECYAFGRRGAQQFRCCAGGHRATSLV